MSDDSEASAAEPLADCAGVVETAIAAALKLAAEAQQWGIVAQLARELETRRGGYGRRDTLQLATAEGEMRGSPPRGSR